MTDAQGPGYRVERVYLEDGRAARRFPGEQRFRQCFGSWQNVRRLARPPKPRMEFDLSGVDHLDGAATALLLGARALTRMGDAPSHDVGEEGEASHHRQ